MRVTRIFIGIPSSRVGATPVDSAHQSHPLRTSIIFLEIFFEITKIRAPISSPLTAEIGPRSWNSFDSPKETDDDSSSVARLLRSAMALNHRSYHGPYYSFRITHVARIGKHLTQRHRPAQHRDSLSSRSPRHSIPFEKDFVGTRSILALSDVNARLRSKVLFFLLQAPLIRKRYCNIDPTGRLRIIFTPDASAR